MAKPKRGDDHSLNQIWIEEEKKFRDATKLHLDTKNSLSIEDVIGKISKKVEDDETKAGNHGKAKKIVANVLSCVQTLGGLAADGASITFPPSSLCFSAISHLISSFQDTANLFAAFLHVLEEVASFLVRFRIYSEATSRGIELDLELRMILHDSLRSLLSICARVYKKSQEHKLGTVKIWAKVFFFSSDEDVASDLGKIKNLVEKENSMNAALGMIGIKGVGNQVAKGFLDLGGKMIRLDDADKRKEAEFTANKQLEEIKKALGIANEFWRRDQDQLFSKRAPGTGQWLVDNSQFEVWASAYDTTAEPILGLEAETGFGKSLLFSRVVHHTRDLYPLRRAEPRVGVAYHYFQKGPRDDEFLVNKALKAMIFQLIQSDLAYRKAVHVVCSNKPDLGDALALWKQFFMDMSRTDASFYLFLDGIDVVKDEQGRPLEQILRGILELSETESKLKVKIFLSGTPKAFKDIQQRNEDGLRIPRMNVNGHNQDDIVKYIDYKMDGMDILRAKNSEHIGKLRHRVRTTLAKGTKGNYVILNYKLDAIAGKRIEAEIDEVLEQANENLTDTTAREIGKLNKSLDTRQIEELNQLLAWVIVAFRPLTIVELEDALYLRSKSRLLLGLKRQLDDYSTILEIMDGIEPTVRLRSDDITDYIYAKNRFVSNVPGSTSDLVLHESEVAIVKRFLAMVCDKPLFDKFGFEDFFQHKLGKNIAQIGDGLGQMDIRYKTLAGCLEVMCADASDGVNNLEEYASFFFVDHLKEVDLVGETAERRSQIGVKLIQLFFDDKIIQKWHTDRRIFALTEDWLYQEGDENVGVIMNWFKDSAVSTSLSQEQKQWVNNLTSNAKPDEDLLRPTAKVMARRWLQTPANPPHHLYFWLLAFTSKIWNRDNNQVKRVTSKVLEQSVEQILRVGDWAKKELKIERSDWLVELQLARTFSAFHFFDECIDRCHKAHDLNPHEWSVDFCLACAFASKGEYEQAIGIAASLLARFRENASLMKDETAFYILLLERLGRWYGNNEEYDKAIKMFEQILLHFPDRYRTCFDIMKMLENQGKDAEINAILLGLHNKVTQGRTGLLDMMYNMWSHTRLHETIIRVAQKENSLNMVKDTYSKAIKLANSDPKAIGACVSMRYWLGMIIYYHEVGDHTSQEAITLWEENLQLFGKGHDYVLHVPFSITATRLALVNVQIVKNATDKAFLTAEYRQKLTELYNLTRNNEGFADSDCELPLSRAFHLMGNDEQARQCLRNRMKVSFDLLSDDDPDNDWYAYYRLGNALAAIDDDINAIAAWRLIAPTKQPELCSVAGSGSGKDSPTENPKDQPPITAGAEATDQVQNITSETASDPPLLQSAAPRLQTSDTEEELRNRGKRRNLRALPRSAYRPPIQKYKATGPSKPKPKPKAKRDGPLGNTCDGRCHHVWAFADDMYVCKDCIDVQFEAGCLAKLRNGTLERNICGKDHSFMTIPEWDEELERLPEGYMMVGETLVLKDDWLNDLRRKFGFDIVKRKEQAPDA